MGLLQTQGMTNTKLPVRARNASARDLRLRAYTGALGLTYESKAKAIFAFEESEEERFQEQMPTIREILRSFMDNPGQQAVPARFGDGFEFLGLLVPQFPAHSMQRILYIYSRDDGGK